MILSCKRLRTRKASGFDICHRWGASKIIYKNVKYFNELILRQRISAVGENIMCFRGNHCTSVDQCCLINNSCFKNIHNTYEAMNCWETKQSASISVKYSSSLHEKYFPFGVSGFYSRAFSGEWFYSNYIINLSNNNRQWFWEAAGYQ